MGQDGLRQGHVGSSRLLLRDEIIVRQTSDSLQVGLQQHLLRVPRLQPPAPL